MLQGVRILFSYCAISVDIPGVKLAGVVVR